MLDVIGSTGVYAIVGVVVLAVASLLGLVLFASKEETFEDVVAAQKKEQEALLNSLQAITGKSGKPNKKWNKLKSKKATKKEHDEHEIDSGVDDDEPSSDSVAVAPKVLEPAPIVPILPPRSMKKSKKVKSEPVEADNISKPNEVEKPKKRKAKKEAKKVLEEVIVSTEEYKAETVVSYPDEEEIILPTEEVAVSAAPAPEPPVETSQKKPKPNKSKQNKPNKAYEVLDADKLIKDMEGLHLNSGEVQHIIDILLAKQNELGQWQKPNQKSDPLEQTRKQLSELDMQLMGERKLAQAAALKNKELRTELQHERTQRQNIQNQASGRLAQQVKEQEKVQKRMEEQHLSEMQSTQIQIQRMQELIDGASHIELRKLKEDNNHLKNASMRAQQLAEDKNSLMNELSQLQQTNKQLRQDMDKSMVQYQQSEQLQQVLQEKIAYYENEIQSSKIAKCEAENSLSQRLQEVNEQLLKVEACNRTLHLELETLRKNNEATQQSMSDADVYLRLSDTERQLSEATSMLHELRKQADEKDQHASERYCELDAQIEEKNNQIQNCMSQLSVFNCTDGNSGSLTSMANTEKSAMEMSDTIKQQCVEIDSLQERFDQEHLDRLAEAKSYQTQLQEAKHSEEETRKSCDNLKLKNNELREKNWKAMDALSKAEEDSKKKIKSMEQNLFKGLKQLHPEIKIPAYNNDVALLLLNYVDSWQECSKQQERCSLDHLEAIKEENVRLNAELRNFEVDGLNKDDLKKMEVENEKMKTVLIETESMLSELQSGVDIEIGNWRKRVEEKDTELSQLQKKLLELDSTLVEHGFVKEIVEQMEHALKEVKQQLEEEKLENEKVKLELEQTLEKLKSSTADAELGNKLKSVEAQLEKANEKLEENTSSSEIEVKDLNSKLKKTISERDLLIREYKTMKEQNAQHTNELKKLSGVHEASVMSTSEEHQKTLKKLRDQISALENTALTSGKGDKEKDKTIAKLYLEIEELKEDLRDERDRVIVDIEAHDTEDLQKQMEDLNHKLQEEKESKLNLSVKLNDLEKSYQEEQSDKDQIRILESKLTAADAKIKELENIQSQQVENQIEEAMQQAAVTTAENIGTSV